MIRHLKIGPDLKEITANIGVSLRYNAAQTHTHLTAQKMSETGRKISLPR